MIPQSKKEMEEEGRKREKKGRVTWTHGTKRVNSECM
jgi:hypothetical protein